MELRCPQCCSPEVEPDPQGCAQARRCDNCGARFSRDSALVTVLDAEAQSADSARLDRIATYMNRPGSWNGGDLCELLAAELRESGRPIVEGD